MQDLKLKIFYILAGLIWLVNTSFGDLEGPTINHISTLDRKTSTANQIFKINEQQRLKAEISSEYMNRIAVINDRILNVFGDDGTFVMLSDEATGQVFIKPTTDNGVQPLSITLITENGITQDLTLIPKKTTAKTLILKSQVRKELNYDRLRESKTPNLQEEWLKIMKQAILGELDISDVNANVRSIAGLKLQSVKNYQHSNYTVEVWLIKNITKENKELDEKIFFRTGDLLISLQKHLLAPSEHSYVYILSE